VHSAESLAAIEAIAGTYGLALPVHLWIDTGMTRDGCDPAQAGDLLRRIADNKRLRLAGVATHFASADTDAAATRVQSERFIKALAPHAELIPDTCLFHQANSFGLFRAGALHSDMVRVGLSLLGYGSEEFPGFADDDGPAGVEFAQAARSLKPTVRWLSRVVHVREIEPGTRVGYGGTWTAPSPEANAQLRGMRIGPGEGRARIAVVPVGYADGYPLALSNIARVGIRLPEDVGTGIVAYAPVVGRVSMDQLTIDVSALPVRGAIVGQEVELISNRPDAPNHLPTLARLAGTITHELLCRLAQVPGRSYVSREVVQDVGGRVVLPPIHPTVRAASAG
jgi:alanine racemase